MKTLKESLFDFDKTQTTTESLFDKDLTGKKPTVNMETIGEFHNYVIKPLMKDFGLNLYAKDKIPGQKENRFVQIDSNDINVLSDKDYHSLLYNFCWRPKNSKGKYYFNLWFNVHINDTYEEPNLDYPFVSFSQIGVDYRSGADNFMFVPIGRSINLKPNNPIKYSSVDNIIKHLKDTLTKFYQIMDDNESTLSDFLMGKTISLTQNYSMYHIKKQLRKIVR